MFKECTNITEINLSNFDTTLVISMDNMFEGCSSLTSLDLTNFKTSSVKRMIFMFSQCSSLTSLDLSKFDTSSVTRMDSMFSQCSSLTSLDLSSFNTSLVTSIDSMFYECINLEYINLYNFNENNIKHSMFENVPKNLVICIKDNSLFNSLNNALCNSSSSNEIFDHCFTIDCSPDWKAKQKKIININNKCVESCDDYNLIEYNGKCYERCPKEILYDNDGLNKKCKCELDKCLLCPQVALNKDLCTRCNTNYYPKENDPLNLGEYINCYNNPEGYYFDKNFYKECYKSCKTCNTEGNEENHNCITCHKNYPYVIKTNDKLNCYSSCKYYYYYFNENNFLCTNDYSCPDEYPKLLEKINKCVENLGVEDVIKDITNIEKNEIEKSKEKETKYYDNVLQSIENGFTSESYDTSSIDNGKDEVIKADKLTVTFTTTENQKNNINTNMTTINLGECETLLRNYYNISSDEKIYLKKVDIVQEGLNTFKVEYNVYAKLFGINLIKLNLSVCWNIKVDITIPIDINEDLDKLNTSSGYYNDICYTTTSKDGTDISLNDRKNEFIDSDKIVCQEGCDFSEYDNGNRIAKCSCEVKESPSSIADMNINKTKLFNNFKDIKNIINFSFLKCYNKLFNKEGIIYNIGCCLIFIFIIFHIISIFIFSIYNYRIIKRKIKNIASKINNEDLGKVNEVKIKQKIDDKEIFIYKSKIKKNIGKINFSNKKLIRSRAMKRRTSNNNSIKSSTNSKIIINEKNKNNKNGIKEKIKNYIDEEINGLSYNLAILYDKRSFCQYYGSLLKTQHNLICAFFNKKDYNSGIIKIDLFLIGFVIEYTINALFYNDDTMHKIYKSKGQFDLEEQLPIIIYSNIISYILNNILNYFALSNDAIISFKQSKIKNNIKRRVRKLVNYLDIKFILYYIISFLFLLFFWYYISMFCVIYKNTQIHLLKDVLISFGLSLLFPFVIYLLPGFLRIPALSSKKKKRQYLYNFSKCIQYF